MPPAAFIGPYDMDYLQGKQGGNSQDQGGLYRLSPWIKSSVNQTIMPAIKSVHGCSKMLNILPGIRSY
ncbi:MAG: hypothetical protein ACYSWZ_08760 [Planctomycetota bacterium]